MGIVAGFSDWMTERAQVEFFSRGIRNSLARSIRKKLNAPCIEILSKIAVPVALRDARQDTANT
jgi:hypothetical protein